MVLVAIEIVETWAEIQDPEGSNSGFFLSITWNRSCFIPCTTLVHPYFEEERWEGLSLERKFDIGFPKWIHIHICV